MKMKKEYLILFAIIAGLSVYLLLHGSNQTHYQLPVLPAIEKKELSRIEIVSPGKTLQLKRKGEAWILGEQEYPADTAKVEDMLNTMDKLTLTDLVSEAGNYGRYDLDEGKSIQVRAWSGDTIKRNLSVGRAATSFQHTFVRLEGDPRVYHARENFRSRFDLSLDQLRDKAVLSFEKSEIQGIKISKASAAVEAVKKEETAPEVAQESKPEKKDETGKKPEEKATEKKILWQDPQGQNLDTTKVERLLSTLSQLKCKGYLEGKKKEDLADPIYTAQIKGSQEYTLFIYAKAQAGEGDYPAVSSQNNYPFLLNSSQAENIMSIFDPPADKAGPKK